MKKLYLGVMMLLFVALATTVFAFGPRGGNVGGGYCAGAALMGANKDFGPNMATHLGLSKEQLDKMWQARETFRKSTEQLRYELFQKRAELSKLYSDPSADEALIQAKQRELNALRQNLNDKMAQFRLEQRKILTPEQLKKLNEFQPGRRGYGPMMNVPCPAGENCTVGQ